MAHDILAAGNEAPRVPSPPSGDGAPDADAPAVGPTDAGGRQQARAEETEDRVTEDFFAPRPSKARRFRRR